MTAHKIDAFSLTHRLLIIFLLFCIQPSIRSYLTSLEKNDANPPYSTLNIDDDLLLTKKQLLLKGFPDANQKKDRFLFSISPFAQNANKGKSILGNPCQTAYPVPCPNIEVALGDLTGRAGMIALLYGKIPAGNNATYPGGPNGYLSQALMQLFPGQLPGTLNDEQDIDPAQRLGYFSNYLNYRKRGARFNFAWQPCDDLIIDIQAGACSIRQVVEFRVNLTDTSTFMPADSTITIESVNTYLMDQVDNIAQDMKLDINDQNQASVEEIRFNISWRHACEINKNENNDWAKFLLIPYAQASGSISPGKTRQPNQLFAVPFGNNGHASTGCCAGINFDFYETVEIGGEVGFTHFFKKDFCDYPVPNSSLQTTFFPFQTNVSIQPGNNWHFKVRLATYHFLENLSMYGEWFVVDHKKDKICLTTPDSAFLPQILEDRSSFKMKGGNFGFNLDASPNFGIGFLWQIPFSQRNTYRSSTIMGGINITF